MWRMIVVLYTIYSVNVKGNQFNPFSIEGVSGSFGNPGSSGSGGSGSRGSFSHPAYSMFMHMPMAFPGSIPDMMYGGASHNGGMECIRGNIVCPEYCIMVDEWGCKACPCGPANGMSPPVVSHEYSASNEGPPRESKGGDCLGTVICMMTCKDGYILGPKGHDGCQSCSCSKKENESSMTSTTISPVTQGGAGQNGSNNDSSLFTPGTLGESCIGPACSAKNDKCIATKLCIASCVDNYVLGEKDLASCQECTCKKKWFRDDPLSMLFNREDLGQKLLEQLLTTTTPAPKKQCPATDTCIRSCTDIIKLGQPDKDGCRSCQCVVEKPLILATSPPEQKLCSETVACMLACKDTGYELGHDDKHGCPPCKCLQHPTLTTPAPIVIVHQENSCPEVTSCMKLCRHGYRLDSNPKSETCPLCRCLIPVPPTTSAPTREPDFLTLMRNCPETVHCMKICKNGYTIEAYQTGSCPACRCHTATTFVLLCEEQLYCPQGCSVGYKCDETSGCPTCTCIKPSETKLEVHVETTIIQSVVQCGAKFSCAERCSFGYKTGNNGCPTCACLEPVLVVDSAGGDVTAEGQTNTFPTTGGTTHVSGSHDFQTHCIGPECSAKNGLGHFLHLTGQTGGGGHLLTGVSTNPGQNGNSGHQSTSSGSSASPGASDGSVTLRAPGIAEIMKTCPALAACVEKCTVGYDIGPAAPGQCPPCQCSYESHPIKGTQSSPFPDQTTSCTEPECDSEGRKQTGLLVSPAPLVNAIPSVEKPCKGPGCARDEPSYLNANSSPTQPITDACTETVQCVRHCKGEYTLRYNGRTTCPSCECASTEQASSKGCIGPACSAANGAHMMTASLPPSPGECVSILNCVLNCDGGYDLGEVGTDGCPKCTCLDDQ